MLLLIISANKETTQEKNAVFTIQCLHEGLGIFIY